MKPINLTCWDTELHYTESYLRATTVRPWGRFTSLMVSLQFTGRNHVRLKLWYRNCWSSEAKILNTETILYRVRVTRPYTNEHKMPWCPGLNSFNGSWVLQRCNELWPWLTQNYSTEEWLVASGCTRCHTDTRHWPKWWHCFRNNLIRLHHEKLYCWTRRNILSPLALLRISHEVGEG